MMSGRLLTSGFAPEVSVGARVHWPLASRLASEHPLVSQPLAAIQRAPGATPIWLAPSAPTIVPIVCVPWPLLSHGTEPSVEQVRLGSYQL